MTQPIAEIMSGDLSGIGNRLEQRPPKESIVEHKEERAGV